MKLFVSYRRAAWSFTYWLVEELRKFLDAEVFVDYSGIDETSFESSLIRNLRESDAVLLIVDEHTFAQDRIHKDGDWVRREIREALTLDKPIILACHNGLFPPADIPSDIQDVRGKQGIEFYPRFFKAGVNELVSFITRATPIRLLDESVVVNPPPAINPSKTDDRSDRTRFHEATALAEAGQYDAALQLLTELQNRGFRLRFGGSLEDVIVDVTATRDAEQRRWDAGEAYDEIAALLRVNLDRARRAWAEFQQEYPEFTDDPAGLADKLKNRQSATVGTPYMASVSAAPSTSPILPPPFAWIDIPAGKVTLIENRLEKSYFGKKGAKKTFAVPAFAIAKYPITNAQFGKFIESEGYSTKKWWAAEGWEARQLNNWIQPHFWNDSQYNPPNHPVVGISWFEAIAFCHWLSETSGDKIMLPTEQMWQRAAQGDDGRAYPWGSNWDSTRCNNHVDKKGIRRTTSVTEYEGQEKGDSPFGVTDMVGNVWEWCSTDLERGNDDLNAGSKYRVMRGGSLGNEASEHFRVDFREAISPDIRYRTLGFRIARF